jgi:hypothetical protein
MQRFQTLQPFKRVPMTDKELTDFLASSAVQFVAEDEEWGADDPTVQEMCPYYSLTGELEAYVIVLQASGRMFTVVGGANMKHPPIIQAYEGPAPHYTFDKAYFIDGEKGKRELGGMEVVKNLYLGAFCYGVEVVDKDTGKTRWLDLIRHREIPEQFVKDLMARPLEPPEAKDDPEPVDRKEAAFVEEGVRMELRETEWAYLGTHSKMHYGYIYGVPRCEWGSAGSIPGGCAPCSAAMVLGYWGRKGYGTLPYIDLTSMGADPDEETLQNALEAAMHTDSEGDTYTYDVDGGIREVLEDYNCSGFRVITHYTLSRTDFIRGVNRVDDKEPFLLLVYDSATYGNHAMPVIGYKYNDGGFFEPWHSMYYKCLTTWAENGTNWVYVSYAEGDSPKQTTVTH